MSVNTFIAFGSNLNQPVDQIKTALSKIEQDGKLQLIKFSSLYKSKPLGVVMQNDFVNAVGEFKTSLDPFSLLAYLKSIEQLHQRVKLQHWGPRTLDLDIILYGEQNFNSSTLTIPHLEMHKRDFVLTPLLEIAPQKRLPNGELIAQIKPQINSNLVKI